MNLVANPLLSIPKNTFLMENDTFSICDNNIFVSRKLKSKVKVEGDTITFNNGAAIVVSDLMLEVSHVGGFTDCHKYSGRVDVFVDDEKKVLVRPTQGQRDVTLKGIKSVDANCSKHLNCVEVYLVPLNDPITGMTILCEANYYN